MKNKLDALTREQIMEFLPAAMNRACVDYDLFMQSSADDSISKTFFDKHNAGKAAIAHIQLLAKLSEWAGIAKKSNKNEDFEDLLEAARREANSFDIPPQDLA